MPDTPNKILRFWNELKRRNVIRRNTVYAATAFVILELVSIIQDPLRLPQWTLPMIIVLLSIGFIVSVVLSWIYEFDTEGNIKKTVRPEKESATNANLTEKSVSDSGWKIASYISFAVILGLVVLNVFSRGTGKSERVILDKSIAVLPFINDSDDKQNEYFINGIMESILDNLSRIKDLRVISRTSVEKYRGPDKPLIPDIAKTLSVGYVLEGSGQKSGDQVRLHIQLVNGETDEHIWSKEFTRKVEDLFTLQSEIARLVASELEAIITPEEEQLIKKIPTTNQVAYEFYQRGLEEFNRYWTDKENRGHIDKAEDLFRYALENDTAFGQAYAKLARVYEQRYWWRTNPNIEMLDSIRILADKALALDDQIEEAYFSKGLYYRQTGNEVLAIESYERELLINPNSLNGFGGLADVYESIDIVRSLEYYTKALSIKPNDGYYTWRLANVIRKYNLLDPYRKYLDNIFQMNGDSASYYWGLFYLEAYEWNMKESLSYGRKALAMDSLNTEFLGNMGVICTFDRQYDSALICFEKYMKILERENQPVNFNVFIGYTYLMLGEKTKGEWFLNQELESTKNRLDQGLDEAWLYGGPALVYVLRNEKDKALENLRALARFDQPDVYVTTILNHPIMDKIREDPEFREIYGEIMDKHEAVQARIRSWLEEHKENAFITNNI